jgi:hypothetical protein
MKRSESDELTRQLRTIGRSTTPQELQARGVRRVRSVSFRELSALVHQAVDQALLGLGAELDAGTLEGLRAAAEAGTARRIDRALEVKDRWRRLSEARSELEERLAPEEPARRGARRRPTPGLGRALGEVEQRFRSRARALLQQLRGKGAAAPETVERWIDESLGMLHESHRRAVTAVTRSDDERVALLERRIHKLLRNLDETEKALGRVLDGGGEDEGLPSIYREFQGLKPRDPHHGRKKELLHEIFLANMNLAGPER